MALTIFQVDAFTNSPFKGNPAGVCILPGPGDVRRMQQIAAEMNLSETAFLYRKNDGFSLRWFTPLTEVALCGHATLAGAHLLYEQGMLGLAEQARFYTRSGLLTARYRGGWIDISLPAAPAEPVVLPAGLVESLGVCPLYSGKNRADYLVALESEAAVRKVRPNFGLLAKAAPAGGVIVTSQAALAGYDFVYRYFDPAEGINEDPVTGSACCCLGPYWKGIIHKDVLFAYQVSERGGALQISVSGSRVVLSGQAVTVLRYELLV